MKSQVTPTTLALARYLVAEHIFKQSWGLQTRLCLSMHALEACSWDLLLINKQNKIEGVAAQVASHSSFSCKVGIVSFRTKLVPLDLGGAALMARPLLLACFGREADGTTYRVPWLLQISTRLRLLTSNPFQHVVSGTLLIALRLNCELPMARTVKPASPCCGGTRRPILLDLLRLCCCTYR
jgi:hypothetical protein